MDVVQKGLDHGTAQDLEVCNLRNNGLKQNVHMNRLLQPHFHSLCEGDAHMAYIAGASANRGMLTLACFCCWIFLFGSRLLPLVTLRYVVLWSTRMVLIVLFTGSCKGLEESLPCLLDFCGLSQSEVELVQGLAARL